MLLSVWQAERLRQEPTGSHVRRKLEKVVKQKKDLPFPASLVPDVIKGFSVSKFIVGMTDQRK